MSKKQTPMQAFRFFEDYIFNPLMPGADLEVKYALNVLHTELRQRAVEKRDTTKRRSD